MNILRASVLKGNHSNENSFVSRQCRFYSVDFKLPFAKVCLRFEHVAKLKLKDFQGPAGRMNEEEFQGFKRTPKFNGFQKVSRRVRTLYKI